MPGITVLPFRSTRVAPAGTCTPAPAATILPSRMTMVPFSTGARPVPSMMRTPVRAVTAPPAAGACAAGRCNAAAKTKSRIPKATRRRVERRTMKLSPCQARKDPAHIRETIALFAAPLQQFDLHAPGVFGERHQDRGKRARRTWLGFGRERQTLISQLGGPRHQVGHPPANVVNRMATARGGRRFLDKHPDIPVLDAVELSLETRRPPPNTIDVPSPRLFGIRLYLVQVFKR